LRYRALSPDDDYVFGAGTTFLVNSPAAVAQAVKTRLRLFADEWFLNLAEGLDKKQILGNRTQGTRDQQVQQRILGTRGVKTILQYASNVDPITRAFSASATIDTIYGETTVAIEEPF
jgi:hypothetical protein